jgi:hypothetical protein
VITTKQLWTVEFYANGELQTKLRLTDEHIKEITQLIEKWGSNSE